MELTKNKSFSSRFEHVLKTTIGIDPLVPGEESTEFFLPGDVRRSCATSAAGRDIENFEKNLKKLQVSKLNSNEDQTQIYLDSDSDSDSDSDNNLGDNPGCGNSSSGNNLDWSDQASRLLHLLKSKRNWKLAQPENLYRFFNDLKLKGLCISTLDSGLRSFENVTLLNLSQNSIKIVENLPIALTVFHAYDNQINTISVEHQVAQQMLHLGLGYNNLSSLSDWISPFLSLQSLDVSFNSLCDLDSVILSLSTLPELSRLHVLGNPFTLIRKYRNRIIKRLGQLEYLDDKVIELQNNFETESDDEQEQERVKSSSDNEECIAITVSVNDFTYTVRKDIGLKNGSDDDANEENAEKAKEEEEEEGADTQEQATAVNTKQQHYIIFEIQLENLQVYRSNELLLDDFGEEEIEGQIDGEAENEDTKKIKIETDFSVEYLFSPTKNIFDQLDFKGLNIRVILLSKLISVKEINEEDEHSDVSEEEKEEKKADEIIECHENIIGEANIPVSDKFFSRDANGHASVEVNDTLCEINQDEEHPISPQKLSAVAVLNPMNPEVKEEAASSETEET